jgi:hypothetical protein
MFIYGIVQFRVLDMVEREIFLQKSIFAFSRTFFRTYTKMTRIITQKNTTHFVLRKSCLFLKVFTKRQKLSQIRKTKRIIYC